MPSIKHIEQQQRLLEAHRATLHIRLIQLAKAGSVNVQPEVIHSIGEAREGIKKAKDALRSWGVQVENISDDEATPTSMLSITISPGNLVFHDRKLLFSCFTESPFLMQWTPPANFKYILGPDIEDCSVECDIRILDDSNDPFSWAGFRVRGFHIGADHLGLGYLTYLRSMGTVEMFRKTKTISGEGKQIVSNAKDNWVKVRTDVVSSKISIWVNDELHTTREDRSFGGPGFLCLHTYYATAQFRNLQVYQIIPQDTSSTSGLAST